MKTLITFLLTLVTVSAYAEKIDCTTRFVNVKAGKEQHVKICGAVSVEKASDNGIKYRKVPRHCNKFKVEFMSIRERDKPQFAKYCESIFTKRCYVVRIYDDASRQGLGHLSSHIVFFSVKAMPQIFNLNASGIGHNADATPGVGSIVRMDLSCRKSN